MHPELSLFSCCRRLAPDGFQIPPPTPHPLALTLLNFLSLDVQYLLNVLKQK